jgi:hypothetical protein
VAERYLGKKPPDTGLDAYSRTVALVVSGFDLALPASAVLDALSPQHGRLLAGFAFFW